MGRVTSSLLDVRRNMEPSAIIITPCSAHNFFGRSAREVENEPGPYPPASDVCLSPVTVDRVIWRLGLHPFIATELGHSFGDQPA